MCRPLSSCAAGLILPAEVHEGKRAHDVLQDDRARGKGRCVEQDALPSAHAALARLANGDIESADG